ncbi:MAG: hypothetical protein COT00_01705 [Candidatus Omnitrophica bacterium CG07_land_8_20_14_0_80_50_8]|nr:MAG: hypothetical protein COT00_01705 [Candidatus Omnitrophica bacterium CG07_land_8_20_14_0_80_50_8]
MSAAFGVDLIEIKKARRFYRSHKDRLNSFFSPREITFIHKNKNPHENLAVLLASKEALFKAAPCFGTGLAAFREHKLMLQKKTPAQSAFKFSVLKNKKYVVVQCVGI